ncbi:DUF6241 domain-containing protein [Evansella tamaricis]|uniref:Uncharacterized protein n=1 Tax=Evansella tamaricis TaxID=2069301 RepID=A0ABS6JJR8_9BACI|nr:DUF6241 domain-containing protein [Evansella tamaricis]MBU9713062.1 hypothetical protein [Evansella tamaricis]
MKKTIIISIIVTVGILVSFFLYTFYNQEEPFQEDEEISQDEFAIEEMVMDGEVEAEEEPNHPGTSADEVVEEFPLDLPEHAVQNYLHYMSHQKVYAEQKWGHMQITPERVERLLEVVNANSFKHEAVYKDILNRWSNGDFSKAVEDHNAIWDLQNGTIGKATRLMTEEEERAYIERHFE